MISTLPKVRSARPLGNTDSRRSSRRVSSASCIGEIELPPNPGAVGTHPGEHGGQRVLEGARRVAGGVRPGEHLVAHRPHGELADRGDQAEADIEVPELEGKALGRSKVGERGPRSGDRVALAGATQLRLDRSGLGGEMLRVGGEQLSRPGRR